VFLLCGRQTLITHLLTVVVDVCDTRMAGQVTGVK